jgi:two-component system phosphate regulon sensor histidine kinase PhoR
LSQAILDALPLPALMVGTDERLELANKAARAIFGEAIIGRHYVTALRQPTLLDAIEQAVPAGKPSKSLFLTTEAGRDIVFEATCSRLATGQVMVVFEDRTAMEEAGQMRRDFVANVSHELRTPLTALIGFIETLQGPAKTDEAARARFLDIMAKEAGRMSRLVVDLLSLSRVEADGRVRPKQDVEIAAVARACVERLARIADDFDVKLDLEGIDLAYTLPGDADQLGQVITNLVENAIKYSGEGSTVSVSLHEQPNAPVLQADAVVLTVKDTGSGLDPIHIPRLTERFYRVDDHRSREMGGTGLGLAIVKHIVSRHRGRLKIESKIGEGSTFSVFLPKRA